NIGFKEKNKKDSLVESTDQDVGYLDCDVKITQKQLQSFTFELEGTNTSGNIGAAGNILYSHRNIFRNAEVLDLKLKGALERQTGKKESEEEVGNLAIGFFNSYEYGLDLSIKFPRFLAPYKLKSFIKRYNPQTSISTNFNYMNRPSYSRTIAGLSFGYFWNSSPAVKHIFKPVVLDFVKLDNPTEDFRRYIERYNLYDSYKDHFILGIGYSIIYNNQQKRESKNKWSYSYLRINTKASGNTLYGIMKLTKKNTENGSYYLANNAFSQFFKFDIDYRHYIKIDRAGDKLVFRTFLGVAYPYGNLKVVPFVEQYFSGGANSIRAWQVRALGPGTYSIPINTDVFPNQTADIKLEGNIEYRAKLFWMLEGALFLDVGNIWAINNQDERTGALFEFKDFYKELAIGTGIGFRLDFDFFIIRFDFGLKLKDPTQPIGKRWIPTNRRFYRDDWTFNVGIGYPF
ncbi:MAG: BamA/TamA family outer membrane protein, partial [bacterium]|nr:BamA/TamA family outer membrane protein [bacterium]